MRIRVMAYNILYGFHEREGDTFVYREERARAAEELVRSFQPDVLAITEAAYCGTRGRLVREDFAKRFELPHIAGAGFEGDWVSVLASRFPLVHSEALPLGGSPSGTRHSALRTTIDCEGRFIHLDVVHPSPQVTEDERVSAFAPLLASAERPYLLLGDFNALDDEDDYSAETLIEQMRAFAVPAPERVAAEMLDRKLIASVRASGLVDTLPIGMRTHTIPTLLDRPHATQGAKLRIDYIFASPDLRVAEAAILQRAPADAASDHYPVVAILEV